jgi:Domain of Unknown Function with PDB structure (DUF3857)/Transglutaminase-like superfamily
VNKRRVTVVCTFAFMIVATGLWEAGTSSGDEWQPISPEELKMTSLPEAPGAPAVILYRQVDRDDGRTPHEDTYVRIKILTEEGRKYANVEIPYVKEYGGMTAIKARTIRPNGSIAAFDGKVYEQTIVKAKGVKYLAKTFTLPDVQVGSIVEYRYTQDFNGVYDSSRWVLSDELFTRKAKFSLKPDIDYALRWSWPQGLPVGAEPPKDEHGTIRMTAANVPAFQVEDYMPPERSLKFRVDFIYSEDTVVEKDPAKYWKSVAKKQNDRVESFVNKRKAMEQAVQQTVGAGDPPEVKLQKIYARVQQLRNTSFELEKTEQEQKREKEKPAGNVEDILKRGYGDGRQITWLFLAMARAAGFEAAPVLISRRSDFFFNPSVMNERELNDNVVQVKVNGKELYFDPGTAFTPYGSLPWWETSVTGLKLTKDGGTWVDTPLPDSNITRVERKADLKLDSEGSLEGKLTITYYGVEAQTLRMEERGEDATSRKKILEDMVRESVPAAIDVELQNQPDWKSSSPSLVSEYSFKVPGWVAGAGKRALLPVGLFSAAEKNVFEHEGRVYSVYFHYPYRKVDDVSIQLPLGWKLGSLAKPVEQDAKAAAYTLKAEDQAGSLHLTRMIRSDLMMVPKANYSALRAFFQMVRTGDEEQVVLQPGSSSAGN